MKYLVLDTYPAIAIPLEALANGAHELKFLESGEYTATGKQYHYADKQQVDGVIVNSSEILPPKGTK